jgi:hypothetical protein
VSRDVAAQTPYNDNVIVSQVNDAVVLKLRAEEPETHGRDTSAAGTMVCEYESRVLRVYQTYHAP